MSIPSLTIRDLTIPVPIIQGGMGVGVSGWRLAAAVANEGGVGVISGAQIGYQEEDFEKNPLAANIRALRKQIRLAREHCPTGAIGVNLMVAMRNYAEYAKVAVEEKVDMIISGAGLPIELPEYAKGTGTKMVPIVSSLRAAQLIIRQWNKKYDVDPDAIIVEGSEAGGHLGFRRDELEEGKSPQLKEIVSELIAHFDALKKNIPVIAAGGIFDGKDIAQYLKLGAKGVQMATRFVATHECDASDAYKQAYLDSKQEDIGIMLSPVGLPGRAIMNDFIQRVEQGEKVKVTKCYQCVHKCDPKTTPFCITKALVNAVKGDTEEGLVFVGSNAYKLDKIVSVKELMDTLKDELDVALSVQ
ncbi:NAD(P)H-dependent flavin oxidoreductase [Anaerotalea alkaliphila]|uniref:Probable nitronate monooxygenase n=1 Tax=Anaerotalea alkaliphila TaxID=2662126 RepID=A0A7X5KP65_9FIRM|nr:nitronate monooxygenase [Anaerotalea alkaliphila]NDL67607.1 nitronate monooxygenase [Anaerotalea alkaliphila]